MFYLVIMTALMFQGALIELLPTFNNLDEIIVVILLIIAVYKIIIRKEIVKFYKYEIISLICIGVFFVVGNFSILYSDINSNYLFSVISGILSLKAIIAYFLARICLSNYKISKNQILRYDKVLSSILGIYCIIAIMDIRFNFLQSRGIRFGIKSIAIGFNHPASFEYFIICVLILKLFIKVKYNLNLKRYNKTILICSFLVLMGGRSKGVAFISLFTLIYIFIRKSKKIKARYFICAIPVMVYVSFDRIVTSLISSEEARGVLYRTSIKIANDYFPLGSGFATFGSDFSRKVYSPIYFNYGINNVWGLSPEKSSFITDTQWASILGEVGYIGTIVYIISLICILMVTFKINSNAMEKLAISGVLMYGLISSISDSILVSFRGTGIFFLIAFFISVERNSNIKKL